MGLVNIKFVVDNETQLSRAFETSIARFLNLTIPFNKMAEDFYQSMTGVFAAEGAFEERPRWQDLSPAYALWKSRNYPGRKILERTGRLKKSLTNRGGSDSVLNITPKSLSVGTKVPYAILHQKGTNRLPMRKIIELTDAQKKRWVRIMHTYMYSVTEEMSRISREGIA